MYKMTLFKKYITFVKQTDKISITGKELSLKYVDI